MFSTSIVVVPEHICACIQQPNITYTKYEHYNLVAMAHVENLAYNVYIWEGYCITKIWTNQ
jgi:hypothetical protein